MKTRKNYYLLYENVMVLHFLFRNYLPLEKGWDPSYEQT